MILGTLGWAEAGTMRGPGVDQAAAFAWVVHLRKVEDALARKDVSAAVRAWHDGYVTALGARRWEGLLEVADAHLRIGEVSGSRKASEPKARELYLAALFRARAQGSLEGVLRAAEAFARFGDREVVSRCLSIAERLAARSNEPGARELVSAFRVGLETRFVGGAGLP
jgi:hypothetical protein